MGICTMGGHICLFSFDIEYSTTKLNDAACSHVNILQLSEGVEPFNPVWHKDSEWFMGFAGAQELKILAIYMLE